MQVIKTLDTNKGTYYYGYISKHKRTEADKAEQKYMIIQKLIGLVAIILAALSMIIVRVIPELGLFTIIMTIIGSIFLLAKSHVVCL